MSYKIYNICIINIYIFFSINSKIVYMTLVNMKRERQIGENEEWSVTTTRKIL